MCKAIKKCMEWIGMISLYIFSLVSICCIAGEVSLSMTLFALMAVSSNENLLDYGITLLGFGAATILYITVLACITATKRMVEIGDNLCKWAPGYSWVSKLNKDSRIYFLFS
jgi:hypothetical protein